MADVDALIDDLIAAHDPKTTDTITFRGAQYDRGLAWVHFPEGFGGLGLEPRVQRHIETRLREAGAPPPQSMIFFNLYLAGDRGGTLIAAIVSGDPHANAASSSRSEPLPATSSSSKPSRRQFFA